MSSHQLGTPVARVNAPGIAYRRADVYNAGAGQSWPQLDYDYRDYRKLGLIRVVEGSTTADARDQARAKYGPQANVFRTARWWVVYAVV